MEIDKLFDFELRKTFHKLCIYYIIRNIRRNYRWIGVERSACEYPNCNICYYYKTHGY